MYKSTTAGSTYCGLNGILDCTSALRKHKEREVEIPLLCFVLKQLYTNHKHLKSLVMIQDRGLEILLANSIDPKEFTRVGVLHWIIEKNLSREDMLEIIYSHDWVELTKKCSSCKRLNKGI